MFKKLLVANRGEIACRIMRTAKRMGIATVAVYSDADARAPHVAQADEAVRLGPAPATESYLKAELILLAARETGADCIHPGYGFLSERAEFAQCCADAGIAFIGPSAAAIAAMGDKIESKRLAQAAGVSVVPGFVGEIRDTDHALEIARGIGFPVMMKASAGGGGKGMRLAYSEQDVREGFDATRREAKASFGDDRVFIEKFVESPRHIEIQLLGDTHGNLVYLGERECSIQRRHQKVVEEAPSPFVTPEMRRAMGEQAVSLARAVGYGSAGTVEFIAGADRGFYFLEMNTRLQVEHPVTECVTGLDLVEQMIRVAAGEPLGFAQDDVRLNGWAIETRVYAEDPYRGFLPSTGRLARYAPPAAERSDTVEVRVDDGVTEGSDISMFYDPMIAKLVTWGETRDAAIDAQAQALDRFRIEGIGHNLDFLSALTHHPRFREGRLTTGFIAEEYPEGFAGAPLVPERLRLLAAVAAVASRRSDARACRINGQLNGAPDPGAERVVQLAGEALAVRMEDRPDGARVVLDGKVTLDLSTGWSPGDPLFEGEAEGRAFAVRIAREGSGWRLSGGGTTLAARVLRPHVAALAHHMRERAPADLSRFLIAPMPGLLTRLDVAAGDPVEAGQPLAVVEAMKMENILRAQRQGRVKAVLAAAGDSLSVDAAILEFE